MAYYQPNSWTLSLLPKVQLVVIPMSIPQSSLFRNERSTVLSCRPSYALHQSLSAIPLFTPHCICLVNRGILSQLKKSMMLPLLLIQYLLSFRNVLPSSHLQCMFYVHYNGILLMEPLQYGSLASARPFKLHRIDFSCFRSFRFIIYFLFINSVFLNLLNIILTFGLQCLNCYFLINFGFFNKFNLIDGIFIKNSFDFNIDANKFFGVCFTFS